MSNPFKKIGDYFSAKSVKQRIYIVIALSLLIFFLVFFIKGNFFDNRAPTDSAATSSVSQSSDETSDNSETPPAKSSEPQFHISFFDLAILIAAIAIIIIRRFIGKRKFRR